MEETGTKARKADAPVTRLQRPDQMAQATQALMEPKAAVLVGKTVTINQPRAPLYDYWRDFTNLSAFFEDLVSIEPLDERRSRWAVKAPTGRAVEWTSVLTEDRPGECIAWASEEGAEAPNSIRIDFRDAPGGRGTWVSVTILYDPPGGVIGRIVAGLFQREPVIQARRDLRRLKHLMETGEIMTAARNRRQWEEERS